MSHKTSNKINFYIITFLVVLILSFLPVKTFASGNITGKIPVSCVAVNWTDAFTFIITPADESSPQATRADLVLSNGDTGFFDIDFLMPGTYHYYISQTKGDNNSITYDSNVYMIDVYVTEEEDGKMSAEPIVYIKDASEKKDSCLFTNIKASKPVTSTGSGNRPNTYSGGSSSINPAKTADNTNLIIWLILAGCASMIVLIIILVKKRTKE